MVTYKNVINRIAIVIIFKQHIVHPEITVINDIKFIFRKLSSIYSYFIYAIG